MSGPRACGSSGSSYFSFFPHPLLEKNQNRPFFAFVSHHAIHSALEARPSSLAKFQAKRPGQQHRNPLYAACLYDLDDGVGLLLEKLQQLGLERNTLVVFTSDNGGTQQSSQEPLRGSKGGYYDGGIREPLIVRWPGVVKAGTRSTVPVHQSDFYPTVVPTRCSTTAVLFAPGDTWRGERVEIIALPQWHCSRH